MRTAEAHVRERLVINARPPYSSRLTLLQNTRFGADWFWLNPHERLHDGLLYSALWVTGYGPVGLAAHIEASLGARQVVDVYLPSRRDIAVLPLLDVLLRRAVGADDDVLGFYRAARGIDPLPSLVRAQRGRHVSIIPDLWCACLLAIALQQATAGRTILVLRELAMRHGTRIRFADVVLPVLPRPMSFPTVRAIRGTTHAGYRALLMTSCANWFMTKEPPNLLALDSLGPHARWALLERIPGIGPHSASVLAPEGSFPLDSWSVPYATPLLGTRRLRSRSSTADLRARLERRFGKWSHYAYAYLLNSIS